MTVAPSPFNGVKVELGIALLLGLLLWLVHERLVSGTPGQLLLLLGYGWLAAGWLVWRTRGVLRRQRAAAAEPDREA
jgi:hypothetical protein